VGETERGRNDGDGHGDGGGHRGVDNWATAPQRRLLVENGDRDGPGGPHSQVGRRKHQQQPDSPFLIPLILLSLPCCSNSNPWTVLSLLLASSYCRLAVHGCLFRWLTLFFLGFACPLDPCSSRPFSSHDAEFLAVHSAGAPGSGLPPPCGSRW
jgi:hypothetical protein